jgi:hypothetical protein
MERSNKDRPRRRMTILVKLKMEVLFGGKLKSLGEEEKELEA